jgi:outer membrane protein assembly factor BamD
MKTRPFYLIALVTWLALCLLSTGCASLQKGEENISYMASARMNYQKGLDELKSENYLEAQKFFIYVKNKFPFSHYATLAELRLGDAFYGEEKYLEAIDAYKLFLKNHPIHDEVKSGYVSYRICQAYVQQIPSDWFIFPPSYEKDQSATKDAVRTLQNFLRDFPKTTYLPKAQKLYRQCLSRLADHELYVANFYLQRDKPQATILRLEGLLKMYPDAGVDPAVLLLLGQTYLKMNQPKKAKETFAKLVQTYPEDSNSAKARLYLSFINGQRE